jgi:hypothetical protein
MNGCPNPDCEFNKTYHYKRDNIISMDKQRPIRHEDGLNGISLCFPQLPFEKGEYLYFRGTEEKKKSEFSRRDKGMWDKWLVGRGGSFFTAAPPECPFCGAILEPPGEDESIDFPVNQTRLKRIRTLTNKVWKLKMELETLEKEVRSEDMFLEEVIGKKLYWFTTDISAEEYVKMTFPNAVIMGDQAVLLNGAIIKFSLEKRNVILELIGWKDERTLS